MSAMHVGSGGRQWRIEPQANGSFVVTDLQAHAHTRVTPDGTRYVVRCVEPSHRNWFTLPAFTLSAMACYRCEREHAESVQHAPKVA